MVMTVDPGQDTQALYGNFAFHVQFCARPDASFAPQGADTPTVLGSFAEISGIEASMEHKVIKEGGRNYGAVMRAGPVTFGTVILKRGVAKSQSLWRWWSMFAGADGSADARPMPANRCDVLIGLIEPVGAVRARSQDAEPTRGVAVGWRLVNAMPVKFRVGDLNAKGGDVAVEEIHLVHQGLEMRGVA